MPRASILRRWYRGCSVRPRDDPDGARRADGLCGSRLGRDALNQLEHLFAPEGLLLEQRLREPVQRTAMLLRQPDGLGVCLVRQAGLLVITEPLRLFREGVVVG